MRAELIIFAIMTMALAGCQGTTSQEVSITSPFIGGTQGLEMQFFEVRDIVFDVDDPFDIVLTAENRGEYEVPTNGAKITLSGINPASFNKGLLDMSKEKGPIYATKKTLEGTVMPGQIEYFEFTGLKHLSPVSAAVQYPLRADVCYDYGTTAISKFCVRDNLQNPRPGGVCEPSGTKPVFSSSAPVQVQNVIQTVRGQSEIGLTFDVVNIGGGNVYRIGGDCPQTDRLQRDKVGVEVESTGTTMNCFEGTSEAEVTLYGGRKTITCKVTALPANNYEQLFTVKLTYAYETSQQTAFTVKPTAQAYPGETPSGG